MNGRPKISRRTALSLSLGAGFASLFSISPSVAWGSSANENPLIILDLRGGLDGLALLPPYTDPNYAERRQQLALPPPLRAGGCIAVTRSLGMHPAAAPLLRFWDAGHMAIAPAIGTTYYGQSHLDAIAALDLAGALSRSGATPYSPSTAQVTPPFLAKLGTVYENEAFLAERMSRIQGAEARALNGLPEDDQAVQQSGNDAIILPTLAQEIARTLAADNGPRIAWITLSGWDTHTGQGISQGPLARRIAGLSYGILALTQALGPAWEKSMIVALGEFGRSAGPNQQGGTENGGAGPGLIISPTLSGSQVMGRLPDLAPEQLLPNGGIAPTLASQTFLKAALAKHWGLGAGILNGTVFPNSPNEGIPSL